VAVLLSQESPAYRVAVDGFRAYLKSHGFTAELDVRLLAPQDSEQARQLRARSPDLVLALGAVAAAAAVEQLAPIPVVAITLRRSELAALDAATGVYLEFPPQVELEWLKRMLPRARRIGVVYNRAENAAVIARAEKAAAGLGLVLVPRAVDSRERLPDALASLANEAQVLWGIADTLVLTPETARSFLLFQFRQRIPFVGLSDAWVGAGALYALDRDWTDLGRQCAELAEQILRGRAPSSLPAAPPRRVLYSVSRRTAETLRLELPAA
jgi:putative ABC transport system substrate-binding protein